MLAHGDELGRTQHGNNNVYCQDGKISWVDWDDARLNSALTEFTARLTRLRAAHPVFRRRRSSKAARSAAPTSRTSPGYALTGSR